MSSTTSNIAELESSTTLSSSPSVVYDSEHANFDTSSSDDENTEELIERCLSESTIVKERHLRKGIVKLPVRTEFKYFSWDFDYSTEFLYRMPECFREAVMNSKEEDSTGNMTFPRFAKCAFIVHEIECHDLAIKDDIGSSDPFVVVTTDSIRAEPFRWKSKVKGNELNPHWIYPEPIRMGPIYLWDLYQVRIMDHDKLSPPDFMGAVRFVPGAILKLQELSGQDIVELTFGELSHCTSLYYIPSHANDKADQRFHFSENISGTMRIKCSVEVLETHEHHL